MQKELELAQQIRKYASVSPFKKMREGGESVASTIEAQAARITQMEAALKPFLYWAETYENQPEMKDHPLMADLRAVRTVIKE